MKSLRGLTNSWIKVIFLLLMKLITIGQKIAASHFGIKQMPFALLLSACINTLAIKYGGGATQHTSVPLMKRVHGLTNYCINVILLLMPLITIGQKIAAFHFIAFHSV